MDATFAVIMRVLHGVCILKPEGVRPVWCAARQASEVAGRRADFVQTQIDGLRAEIDEIRTRRGLMLIAMHARVGDAFSGGCYSSVAA